MSATPPTKASPSSYESAVRAVRERTRAGPEQVARVRRRLDLQLLPVHREVSVLPTAPDAAVARVRARLRQRERPRAWPAAAIGFGLAAAAAAFVVGGIAATERGGGEQELLLAGRGEQLRLTDDVVVAHDGEGRAAVTDDGVTIDWEIGRLRLDVAPERGVRLVVRTPEGEVRVVGTTLIVQRDALGTSVEVERGEIALACAGADERKVGAGASSECWPVTAAGLLNRARALEDRSAHPDEVLETVAAGLAAGGADVLRGELLALRTGALVAAGRPAEALDAAEEALSVVSEPARSEALRKTASRLALLLGECDRARLHLDAMTSPGAEERALLDGCR